MTPTPPTPSTPLHALVIGSGIAGPVLAMSLLKAGMTVSVFDKTRTPDGLRGSWITFQANGMDALRAIGASKVVKDLGFPLETVSFINGSGKDMGAIPLAAPREDGTVSRMMRRADLYRVLADEAASRGANVQYDKELVDVQQPKAEGGKVVAVFADGSTAEGDVLIGADGIHSRVHTYLDPDAASPKYVPLLNTAGYVPDLDLGGDAKPAEFRMQFGTRAFFGWTQTPDGGVVWFANPPMETEPPKGMLTSLSDAEWRQWIIDLHEGDVGPVREIVEKAPDGILGWATYELPSVKVWHNDSNVVIVGDAVHATAPASGQGASMALEDAVILAQCLRDCATVPSALWTFEHLRRDRVERVVRHGQRGAANKAPGWLGRILRDLIVPFIMRREAADGGKRMMWLQGHHIEWDDKVVPYVRVAGEQSVLE